MKRNAAFGALFLLLASALVSLDVSAAEPLRITTEELKQRLGNQEIVIVDVRSGSDWKGSDRKIAGAVREEASDVGGWEKRYAKDKPMILYCAWSNEHTSASVALRLIEKGFTKISVLKGGWDAWVQAGYPTVPK